MWKELLFGVCVQSRVLECLLLQEMEDSFDKEGPGFTNRVLENAKSGCFKKRILITVQVLYTASGLLYYTQTKRGKVKVRVNSLSVHLLFTTKSQLKVGVVGSVPCDHQSTCVPAAGVTRHLDPSSSPVLHTNTHTRTHAQTVLYLSSPSLLIQMVLFISHSAADGALLDAITLTL